MIRLLIIILFSMMTSCKTNTTVKDEQKEWLEDKTYKHIPNPDHTFILHYKIEEHLETGSPIKQLTYFVGTYKGSKIVTQKETVAAERIYWKDNNTIAIVPYTDAARLPTDVDAANHENEILIQIK